MTGTGAPPSKQSGGTVVRAVGSTLTVGLRGTESPKRALAEIAATEQKTIRPRRTGFILLRRSLTALLDLGAVTRHVVGERNVGQSAGQLLSGVVIAARFVQRHRLVVAKIFLAAHQVAQSLKRLRSLRVTRRAIQAGRHAAQHFPRGSA